MSHPEDPLHASTKSPRSTGSRIEHFKKRTKEKAKKALGLDPSDEDEDGVAKTGYEEALEEIEDSPAFNSSKFLNKARIGPAGIPDKLIAIAQATGDTLVHPIKSMKTRATKKTAGKLAKSRPYLSRKADLDFLEAHDDLEKAASEGSNDDAETIENRRRRVNHCQDRIEEMEATRQSMRVAWVTARHVQRVRAVKAVSPPPMPPVTFFEKEDDCGYPEFQWWRWLGYKLLNTTHNFTAQYIDDFDELPFDFDTLRRHVERLIIVSAPLQTFISDVRRIYRWDDPVRTAKWMALYFFLWYHSHIVTFIWGYLVFSCIKNYYYPTSLEDLRDAIERSIDRGARALQIGELMDKHGSNDWLGPLLDELGPFVQIQVADFANFLESTYNYFHWQNRRATACTLVLFVGLFLVTALVDSRAAMSLVWLGAGMTFFVLWPISSRYPRYRLLVSPLKWALWDVPTHAEWCFQYLRDRSMVAKEAILRQAADEEYMRNGNGRTPHLFPETEEEELANESSDDDDDFSDALESLPNSQPHILSFTCTHHHTPGHLIISTSGLRFEPLSLPLPLPLTESHLQEISFNEAWSSIVEMSKRQTESSVLSPLVKITMGMEKLEVVFCGDGDGEEEGEGKGTRVVFLENMRGRDRAFNAVIGFSGVRWQNLQQREG